MDILRFVSEKCWELLAELPVEFTGLFSRMALILVLLVACGAGVKQMYQKGFKYPLPLQIASGIVSVIIGLIVRLDGIAEMPNNGRNILLVLAFCCCAIFPIISVRFIIRQKGPQNIAWKVIYGIEGLLLLIQIIVCIWR